MMKKTILILVLLAGAGVAAYFIYKKVQADKNGMTLDELRNTENNNKRIENGEIAGPPQIILKNLQTSAKATSKYVMK